MNKFKTALVFLFSACCASIVFAQSSVSSFSDNDLLSTPTVSDNSSAKKSDTSETTSQDQAAKQPIETPLSKEQAEANAADEPPLTGAIVAE